ncbi:hypothetical protein EVG20_g1000 [Dentipellis fragilis]|uniref:enoyl-[acyl-carrier-protein] reductase n=1 Tax=Dentipellis fragilis TaxID=205917 RepID=A0A4Y9ZCY7_9AGAM|nr:hypothetical protein EVG20_g1000 [Dentipellis fragilis]
MVCTGNSIPFSFCLTSFITLLRRISKVRPRESGSSVRQPSGAPYLVLHIFEDWIVQLQQLYPSISPGTGSAIFRLLFPEEDIQRKYQLQEKLLGRTLCTVFDKSKESIYAHTLKNWNAEHTLGCLGDEVRRVLECTTQNNDEEVGPLSIFEIDALLTELASLCAFSDASVRQLPVATAPRSRADILRALYNGLPPLDAAFLTQIILKDLRPLLYPLSDTHSSSALKRFKSNAIKMLSKEDAMKAWDKSGRMLRVYHSRASLHEAATFIETNSPGIEAQPSAGTQIEIPKCRKGQGCKQALGILAAHGSTKVWAETKYDGERAQIHVQVAETGSVDIKIFSKSARDSTNDRYAVHQIIMDALGLQRSSADNAEQNPDDRRKIHHNIVLEAEMVAFSTQRNRVDGMFNELNSDLVLTTAGGFAEFWRIRSLIESTAKGVRGKRVVYASQQDSQTSMISNASDGGTRHLALVFFDILLLDSKSLLHIPYYRRRALLEMAGGEDQLRRIFAAQIADFEEGLVLKVDESRYRDHQLPWIKLKRDYIPGHGDSLDLVVVGAGWDKSRGRELRVSPSTLTTFYIGLLSNSDEMKANSLVRPHFKIYFTVSYGLTREQLEEENFYFNASDHVKYDDGRTCSSLPYTFTLFKGLSPPSIMLDKPVLADVFGAGFTKADNSKYYELRWPRISKLHRAGERDWKDAVTLQEVQDIAHEVVGRKSSLKEAEEEIHELWANSTLLSVSSPKETTDLVAKWVARMEEADGVAHTRKNVVREGDYCEGRDRLHANEGAYSCKEAVGRPRPTVTTKALGSTANVREALPPTPPSPYQSSYPRKRRRNQENDFQGAPSSVTGVQQATSAALALAFNEEALPLSPSKKTKPSFPSPAETPVISTSIPLLGPQRTDPASNTVLASFASNRDQTPEIPTQTMKNANYTHSAVPATPKSKMFTGVLDSLPRNGVLDHQTSLEAQYTARLVAFLRDSFVWLGHPVGISRPSWRRPSYPIIPHNNRIHCLDSFLLGCGWGTTANLYNHTQDRTLAQGVILLDISSPGGSEFKGHIYGILDERCNAAMLHACSRKPIWVLDMCVLRYGELERYKGNFERYLLRKILKGFGAAAATLVQTTTPTLQVAPAIMPAIQKGVLHTLIRRHFSTSLSLQANRAVVYSERGPPSSVLQAVSYPDLPPTSPGLVNLRVLLSPVNPSDINVIEGVYPLKPNPVSLPSVTGQVYIGGNEGLAEVKEIGEGVEGLEVGDWVIPVKPQPGTWNSALRMRAHEVVKVPRRQGLSPTNAATLTVNPPTAYNMLRDYVDLQPGDWVVQNGANSAVGQAVIQIAAKLYGARTINLVRNRENIDELKQELTNLGATHVLTYDELLDKDIKNKVKEWTGSKDIRLGLNCVSGKPTTLMARLLGKDAHLVSYGAMSKQPLSLPTSLFIFKNLTCHGFWQSRWYSDHSKEEREELMRELVGLMATGQLMEPKHEIVKLESTDSDELATSKVQAITTKIMAGQYGRKVLLEVEQPR